LQPSIQIDCSVLDSIDLKKNKTIDADNVANVRKEKVKSVEAVSLVPKSDIAYLNKIINDEIKKQSAKFWYDTKCITIFSLVCVSNYLNGSII
jgi:hypothetical protein